MRDLREGVQAYAARVVIASPSPLPGLAAVRRDPEAYHALRQAADATRQIIYADDGVAVPPADPSSVEIVLRADPEPALIGTVWVQPLAGRLAHVGGWAVAQGHRSAAAGLCLALVANRVVEVIGAYLAVVQATQRHGAARMLMALDEACSTGYDDPEWGRMRGLLYTRAACPLTRSPEGRAVIEAIWSSIPVVTP